MDRAETYLERPYVSLSFFARVSAPSGRMPFALSVRLPPLFATASLSRPVRLFVRGQGVESTRESGIFSRMTRRPLLRLRLGGAVDGAFP